MTTQRDDFMIRLEDYLDQYEGATPLPASVRDSIRAAVPHTGQDAPGIGDRTRYLGVAAVALILAAIGFYLATVGSNVGHRPSPSRSPLTSSVFERPFSYTLPSEGDLQVTDPGAFMFGFTDGGTTGDRGVIVALPGAGAFGGATWCFGPGNGWSPQPTLEQVLSSYREWLAPDGIVGGVTSTTVDGYPAGVFHTESARCPTLHPTERTHVDPEPGTITVLDVNGSTVVVAIWGHSDTIFEAWLAAATQFVETIHFSVQEKPT